MSFDLFARQIKDGELTPYHAIVYAKPDLNQSRTNQYGELLLAKIRDTEIEYALPVQLIHPLLGIEYPAYEIFPNPFLMLLQKLTEERLGNGEELWVALPWLVKHSDPEDLKKDLRRVLQECYDEAQQLDGDIGRDNELWLESALSCLRLFGWTRSSEGLMFKDVPSLEHPLLKQASEKIATKYWEAPKVSWPEWSRKIDFIMESIRNPEIGEIYGY